MLNFGFINIQKKGGVAKRRKRLVVCYILSLCVFTATSQALDVPSSTSCCSVPAGQSFEFDAFMLQDWGKDNKEAHAKVRPPPTPLAHV